MIISMSNIICVTNRLLCEEPFLERIEEIAKARPKAIILREKELSEEDYERLAKQVLSITKKYKVPCILHSHLITAKYLQTQNNAIHLPLSILRSLSDETRKSFKILGSSCHSIEEAQEAERLDCTYLIAGHIFKTDCKKDVPPRGIAFLRAVCESVNIPVYAIGGITAERIPNIMDSGAKGACIMSGFMRCNNPSEYIQGFEEI